MQAAEAINAKVFTSGNDIVFNAGEYDPESADGQHLLAHELVHVRQQTGGAVSILPQENLGLEIDPDPRLEREADEAAAQTVSGEGPLVMNRMGTDVHIQRVSRDSNFAKQVQKTDGTPLPPGVDPEEYQEEQEQRKLAEKIAEKFDSIKRTSTIAASSTTVFALLNWLLEGKPEVDGATDRLTDQIMEVVPELDAEQAQEVADLIAELPVDQSTGSATLDVIVQFCAHFGITAGLMVAYVVRSDNDIGLRELWKYFRGEYDSSVAEREEENENVRGFQ